MRIDAPQNENYAATVVRLPPLRALDGSDNLVGASLFGFQAIIDKSHTTGELGIVFPAECQLSDEFCSENGLYRHGDKNKDPDAKGYLEDNRRVRAIKLRGHRSDCLFMPVASLAWTKAPIGDLQEGDTFDVLNGKPICQKYVVRRAAKGPSNTPKQEKKFDRVDPRLFPEHLDTANYFRQSDKIPADAHVWVTQKLHGTSWRGSRSHVLRMLTFRDRVARKFGVAVQEREWDTIAGSRKVVKDPNNSEQNHFYGADLWTEYLPEVEGSIPEGFVVYGEIIGWAAEGAPIQTDYTYGLAPGTRELYVYRVATVNVRGVVVDLSYPQVVQFCAERGLKVVPLLWEGLHKDFVPDIWLDKRFDDGHRAGVVPLGQNPKLVDEGVCIRADIGLTPTILKAKSPQFLAHETKLLDRGEENVEDAA